jgi:hypothetical protein
MNSSVLSIQKLNRKQNHFSFLFYDVATKLFSTILTEESSTGWIPIADDFVLFKVCDFINLVVIFFLLCCYFFVLIISDDADD